MRHLVRFDPENRLTLSLCGHRRVVEKHPLEREDRAPILHRAEELRLSWASDVVELREREGHSEILVVIGQDLGLGVERGTRLGFIAEAHDDAGFRIASHLGDSAELAGAEEQQV